MEIPGGLTPAGSDQPGEESIFDYGSRIGLLPDSEGDYWIHETAASTWTRVIVVPRREFYHTSEGSERSTTPGPMLANLGDLRRTITSSGNVVQDNWRKAKMKEGPYEDLESWIASCIFRERWSTTSEDLSCLEPVGLKQIDRAADIPGPLVFKNVPNTAWWMISQVNLCPRLWLRWQREKKSLNLPS